MAVACRFLACRAILGRVVRQPHVAPDAAGAVRRSLAVRTLAARRSGGRDLRSHRAAVAAPTVVVGAVPGFVAHFGRTPGASGDAAWTTTLSADLGHAADLAGLARRRAPSGSRPVHSTAERHLLRGLWSVRGHRPLVCCEAARYGSTP